jgi:hypothetical protein
VLPGRAQQTLRATHDKGMAMIWNLMNALFKLSADDDFIDVLGVSIPLKIVGVHE